jgi:hypothetical protein
MLAALAVRLLSGPRRDLARGAELATRQGLAGLFLEGLAPDEGGPLRDTLRRAAQREAAHDAQVAREIDAVLETLSALGLEPVPLKGRALALEAWPRPALRPPGDLDLLLEPLGVEDAAIALVAKGYRRTAEAGPGRLRVGPTGIELMPPEGRKMGVDLHARLFRSVGSRLDATALLARAQPSTLQGHAVRALSPADRLLFLFVHAAKHGVRTLKWLLDLHAVAALADEPTWQAAVERAGETGCARAFWAAASLIGEAAPEAARAATRPPGAVRVVIERLISVEDAVRATPLSRAERYALELVLEPSLAARAKMGLGMVEGAVYRMIRRAEERR